VAQSLEALAALAQLEAPVESCIMVMAAMAVLVALAAQAESQ
jgi:hypothetical protein